MSEYSRDGSRSAAGMMIQLCVKMVLWLVKGYHRAKVDLRVHLGHLLVLTFWRCVCVQCAKMYIVIKYYQKSLFLAHILYCERYGMGGCGMNGHCTWSSQICRDFYGFIDLEKRVLLAIKGQTFCRQRRSVVR